MFDFYSIEKVGKIEVAGSWAELYGRAGFEYSSSYANLLYSDSFSSMSDDEEKCLSILYINEHRTATTGAVLAEIWRSGKRIEGIQSLMALSAKLSIVDKGKILVALGSSLEIYPPEKERNGIFVPAVSHSFGAGLTTLARYRIWTDRYCFLLSCKCKK